MLKYSLISFHDRFHGVQLEFNGTIYTYRYMYGDKTFAEKLVHDLDYQRQIEAGYVATLDETKLVERMRYNGGTYEIVHVVPGVD